VEIAEDGAVQSVSVMTSSGEPAFDEAAVAAAKRGTYAPATLNGAKIAHAIRFTVRFRLRKGGGR
jgi:TonB family protein